ncbi:MAG: acylphosphatase [Woeseiaceae bacterium]|nr:acylphosphatase [Woeseiaceae bacterium]
MSGSDRIRDADGVQAIGEGAPACRLFRVTGRVQGVFFRASTQTAARDLGLGGYARNLDDGAVEVLACGSNGSLDALQRWLREGPPMAQVDDVQ